MNERQIKFIEMLEKHLAQEVSLKQMKIWLTKNIKPTIFRLRAYMRPGMWLEMYAYREIHWHIEDIEDTSISKGPNLDWYWEEVKRVLDLLLGNEIYKKSVYWVEYPLIHKQRELDKWMMPHLKYVEEIFQILAAAQKQDNIKLNLPKLDIVFENRPLSLQTGAEIIMNEMLTIVEDYEELTNNSMRLPEHYDPIDMKSVQLRRLEKLVKCYKGELHYSASARFEGLDKFAVTIVI